MATWFGEVLSGLLLFVGALGRLSKITDLDYCTKKTLPRGVQTYVMPGPLLLGFQGAVCSGSCPRSPLLLNSIFPQTSNQYYSSCGN